MSTKEYSLKLLDMEDAIIEEYKEGKSEHYLTITLKRKEQLCPACGESTETIHDYRIRRIVDFSVRYKRMIINYRRRRYVCPCCQKRFAEPCGFAGRYQRFTCRLAVAVMDRLRLRHSMKDIAMQTGVSVSATAITGGTSFGRVQVRHYLQPAIRRSPE